MKLIFILAAVCLVATACNRNTVPSASPIVNSETQNEQGKTILAGHCSLSMLYAQPYSDWFYKSYSPYNVDSFTTHLIAPMLKNKTVQVFLGSWCGDSKREVPRLVKILQTAQFDTANLRLVFVDNSTKKYKQSPQHEEAGLNIHHVPTIIVYNNSREQGRIIESPQVSLEKDLLAILLHQPYQPNYQGIAYWVKHVKNRSVALSGSQLKTAATAIAPLCSRMGEFNAYGYVLLAQNNYTEAVNVFKLNTLLFPQNPGTYDSLGEAYYATGNNADAKTNYEKVLALKPGDENATKMLEKLK
jgi:tetratricopeptide (TPR) repeat protein